MVASIINKHQFGVSKTFIVTLNNELIRQL